jgi:hypothetical protein
MGWFEKGRPLNSCYGDSFVCDGDCLGSTFWHKYNIKQEFARISRETEGSAYLTSEDN